MLTRLAALLLCLVGLAAPARAQQIVLFDGRQLAGIVHDRERSATLAAELLGRDLTRVTGQAPVVSPDLAHCAKLCIVVGRYDSDLVRAVAQDTGVELSALRGQWERYVRVALRSKRDPSRRYLLIAGSDRRGAIWGTIDLSREIGVSAWEWWADAAPRRVGRLAVDGGRRLSDAPSVQYRGIFLNDEDWGLQPWAAKTYEPETGDIGPKTYARVFELMWRLKANLIWPAMHDSTKPFYQIPGNAEVARDYAIVVGTSHAEPMMRNNVREWDEKTRGPFNFFTNRDSMIAYWRERAEQVKAFENLYSIGLRGRHDSAMEGATTPAMARDAMTRAMAVQRDLLSAAQKRPAAQVPQVLTLYKEVLDTYAAGLEVPEDVTLIWPDDNYGYISQLPNPREQARAGGSGIYYHISYWGRPHDYLWLATTHPALIREQLDRAWQMHARKIWVVNVGDIKPSEYLTQYFLDIAFDRRTSEQDARAHLEGWVAQQFGGGDAGAIAGILADYYDLAFERRPEFMGFSQVEPTRPIRIGDYVRSGGAEAQVRIDRYVDLKRRAEAIAARIPADRKDAFFQFVLYPVRSAANINVRNLKLDLAALYARQGRADVNAYAEQARAAHAAIVADTAAYNSQNGGKWRGIMDMAPRRLPVFDEPVYPRAALQPKAGCTVDSSELVFAPGRPAGHAVTISSNGQATDWSLAGAKGLSFEASRGRLDAENGFEQRVRVDFDGHAVVGAGSVECGGRMIRLTANVLPASADVPVEMNRIISLAAAEAPLGEGAAWERVPGLGSRGAALRSRLGLASVWSGDAGKPISLRFRTGDEADAELRVVALPAHPLAAHGLRLGVQVDDGAIQILDFETHGRSEAWKRNVLSNNAVRSIALPRLAGGAHQIRLYALDPGFLLDRIDVRLDGAPDYYGAPPDR
ncbi:glycosyl hydrolase 115 family protein [Sphingomonas sp. JC676]|uniref:glycosyl hydrolase 115 family protein n=1 Tax=Sphingomonas sp. JC676 TaxID=2768065 RepID=UPI001657B72F|nr:glycosyl hydrolase 115 family protein [Sphingomonas sp. JC676]MBC9032401.1 glycosyl hydrolase 115 family protein [Sphingomonas sp. JC676]